MVTYFRGSARILAVTCMSILLGCAPPAVEQTPVDQTRPAVGGGVEPAVLQQRLGVMMATGPIPFVAKAASFATSRPDTALVLVSVSIPNRVLSFVREGDRYRAPYEMRIRISKGGREVASVTTLEIVRVGTFRETNRTDESVIFQHFFRIPPGTYDLSALIRDVAGSRSSTQESSITVPRLAGSGLSTPLLVYDVAPRTSLDSLPRILASPRSSAVFGRDTAISVYLEGYGAGSRLPVHYVVTNDRNQWVLSDSTVLPRHGGLFSGLISVPVSTIGLGVVNVNLTTGARSDTTRLPVFVSFGEDIPIMSFEGMLEYLRFFAPAPRLKALRDAPANKRAASWAEFLRQTDMIPETPVNEELQAYFARIQLANAQFLRDKNPGWLSDRGMVFVALGEPDQILERNINQQVTTSQVLSSSRLQVWEYRQYHTQFVFYEEAARWRLTRASENEFWTVNARRLAR